MAETWLIYRHFAALQCRDLGLVLVDAGNHVAQFRETGAGDETHITGSYHCDVHETSPA